VGDGGTRGSGRRHRAAGGHRGHTGPMDVEGGGQGEGLGSGGFVGPRGGGGEVDVNGPGGVWLGGVPLGGTGDI
jgi:hypothetical protein